MKCDRSAKRDKFVRQALAEMDEMIWAMQAAGVDRSTASRLAYVEVTKPKFKQPRRAQHAVQQ